jgi:hypothetical protein
MNRKEHLRMEGLQKIVSIRASINKGLSAKLTEAFPNIVPIERPLVEVTKISDPNWLVGFVEEDGCFHLGISQSKTHKAGIRVRLHLTIAQHSTTRGVGIYNY